MSSPPDWTPQPPPTPTPYPLPTDRLITHMFQTGSSALANYLAKYAVGNQYAPITKAGDNPWMVKNVDIRTNIPPDPVLGDVTVVMLTINQPAVQPTEIILTDPTTSRELDSKW